MSSSIRIASRQEGDYINFYIAAPNTMEGAHLLLSAHKALIATVGWEAAKDMVVKTLSRGLKEAVGVEVNAWTTELAPEHERSGRG